MSTYDVQRAVALLIRRPDSFRGEELPQFLSGFDLSDHEKFQITHAANNRSVAKFGRIMAASRERKVSGLLTTSRDYLPAGLLGRLWKDHFEPRATHVRFNQLPSEFLKFLLEDTEAQRLIAEEAPPFMMDMLLFESAQGQFRMKHFSAPKHVNPESCLVHANFILLELNHDIQGLRAQILREKPEPGTLAPEPRNVKLLFLRHGLNWEPRIFEIDQALTDFLDGQIATPIRQLPTPDSYSTLVKIGLCKENVC